MRAHLLAVGLYLGVALLFNWPLPAHLTTHFTGPVGGDAGVYIWNLWLFRHEMFAHTRFPLFTHEVLSLTPPVDLSLHNYTLFADLIALPVLPIFGLAGTFNLIYLAILVLTAWSMYLLASAVVGRGVEAWMAGLMFGFSPFVIARSIVHFSLVTAAPLPIFLWILLRAERSWTIREAVAAGVTIAWATMCDPYYGVFCLVIAASFLTARFVTIARAPDPAGSRAIRFLDVLIAAVAAIVIGIGLSGGVDLRLYQVTIHARTLWTPVLVMTVLLAVRYAAGRRLTVLRPSVPTAMRLLRFWMAAAISCVIPLSPMLYALASRLRDGGSLHHQGYWRSSQAGMDLLAFFLPNPNNPLIGSTSYAWLNRLPRGFSENVASLTVTGVIVMIAAVCFFHFRPPAVWTTTLTFFGSLALGPFIRVGAVNTYVPTPGWSSLAAGFTEVGDGIGGRERRRQWWWRWRRRRGSGARLQTARTKTGSLTRSLRTCGCAARASGSRN